MVDVAQRTVDMPQYETYPLLICDNADCRHHFILIGVLYGEEDEPRFWPLGHTTHCPFCGALMVDRMTKGSGSKGSR